jgi:hypothetical protein
MPSRNDGDCLSTRRNVIGAQQAYEDWTTTHESTGSWSLNVGQAIDLELKVYDDSSLEGNPPGHASVDFAGRSRGQRSQIGRKLAEAARCLYAKPSA